ncbi:DUF4435 domain-containing protein [Pectobacterium carotovorum]|uniref:DUF4435 domain-containing protein n=1 Tax=Pectobacterium carotovorum TaxID=554 RepID=UPI003015D1BF
MNIDYQELLDNAVEAPETALHNFLLSIVSGKLKLHVYFEGKDDNLFYYRVIKRLVSDNVTLRSVICKNKKLVYDFHSELSGQSDSENKIIYFVDKDIDDLSNEEEEKFNDIHVSEIYSIENYIPSEEIISSYCIEGFSISSESSFIPAILERYEKEEINFFESIRVLMGWAIFCRRNGNRPNFNNINFNDLFDVDSSLSLMKKMSDDELYDYFKNRSNVDFSLSDYDISGIHCELNSLNPRVYVRGKFHLAFFCKFMNKIKDMAREGTGFKQNCSIDPPNVMMWSGPRLTIPESVRTFINTNVPEFI